MKLIGLLSCYKVINLLQPMIKNNLFQFIYHRIHKLGIKLIYSVLLMFYAYQSEHTPPWAKRIITGAIAYLLLPLDGLPDLTPFIGFTDDLGVISFGLVSIACYIDAEVRTKAKLKLSSFFKNIDESVIQSVDQTL